MFMEKDCNCPFCTSKATSQFLGDFNEHRVIECALCGKYIYNGMYDDSNEKNYIASYLFYNKKTKNELNYIGTDKYYDFIIKDKSACNFNKITPEIIHNYKFMTFPEKINQIMIYLGSKSKYMGEFLEITTNEISSAFFSNRYSENGQAFGLREIKQQISMILEYLRESDLIKDYDIKLDSCVLCISTRGWQLIEQIQKDTSFGKKVFIAMSFKNETITTREALKTGITNAGYTPVLIDEVTHNQQIVPEMFKQIRDSKFLVIDVSVPNNGAYYEAGYALGLGKEVIFCCSQKSFEDKEKRPHFDVSQKQMIVWNDEADLSDKLEKWIKSLFE